MAGITEFVEALRNAGFGLVFLWLLTLSLVYGILSHVGGGLPKSHSARGIISISAAFLILLAASGPATATFLSNLIGSLVIIGFGLLITVIFLEIGGVKIGDKTVLAEHGKIFGLAILILVILIFIGAGVLKLVGLQRIDISGEVAALILFVFLIIAAVYVMLEETKGAKK